MNNRPLRVQTLASASSMGADFASNSVPIAYNLGYAIQMNWSGTSPVGQAKLQASLDNSNWVDVTDSALAVSGNTGSNIWTVRNSSYSFVRLYYTRTGGTGSAEVLFSSNN